MITIHTSVREVLESPAREFIETQALPRYLPHRRWFAAKGETLRSVRLDYAAPLPGAPDLVLSEFTAELDDRGDSYVLPLAICWDDDASLLAGRLALAPVRHGERHGVLTDGFAADALAFSVMALLHEGATLPLGDAGELRFRPTSALHDLQLPPRPEIRRLSAEQSNSSMILGDALVLKLVRHVAAGTHPEAEMTRVLTARGYANSTPLFGEVVRVDASGTSHTLMLAQGFVANQGDGWGWTLEMLAQADGASAAMDEFAAAMGRRLAELHIVLSQPTAETDFSPEPADEASRRGWAEGAISQLDLAIGLLRARREWPSAAESEMAATVSSQADALRAALHRLAARGAGAMRIRVHGDFHLGQVLAADGDAYIIDFEGEPARTLAQRREKSCAMRDVAGLLRSFDYAAATAIAERPSALAVMNRYREDSSGTFLHAYQQTLAASPHPVVPREAQAPLLDLFLIEKAAYEIRYEATNRPAWLGIPLRGLHDIATRVLSGRRDA